MASSLTASTILERVVSNRDGPSQAEVVTRPKELYTGTTTTRSVSSRDSVDDSPIEGLGSRLETFEISDVERQDVAVALQSFSNPPMNKYRFFAVCTVFIANGMSDSAAGVLILYMEKTYSIGYAVVSIIFITTALGFIAASLFVDGLHKKIGSGRALFVAEGLKCLAYTLITPVLPYPVVCLAFFLIGCGMSIGLGIGISFVTNLANGPTMLGLCTGAYGIGGVLGPLIATSLTANKVLWARFYLITLALAIFNTFFASWAFWSHEKDSQLFNPPLAPTLSHPLPHSSDSSNNKLSTMKTALSNKITLLASSFIFVYQGAEVAISGWVITYLITFRKGDPATSGYVTAGFWAGVTLGRFFLTKPLSRFGEKRANYLLISGSILFDALAWGVPNVIGDAVAVCIVGILIGPIYPCACNSFVRLLPRDIQIASIALIQGMGSSGGAAVPFITGVLAQVSGTFVVHPIVLASFALALIIWFFLPNVEKREE